MLTHYYGYLKSMLLLTSPDYDPKFVVLVTKCITDIITTDLQYNLIRVTYY